MKQKQTFAGLMNKQYAQMYVGEGVINCDTVWMNDRIAFVEAKHLLLHKCDMRLPIPNEPGYNLCGRVISTNKCNRCGEDVDEALPHIDQTDYGLLAERSDKLYIKQPVVYTSSLTSNPSSSTKSFWRP